MLALSANTNIHLFIKYSLFSVYDLLPDPHAPALFIQEQNPKLSLGGFSDLTIKNRNDEFGMKKDDLSKSSG